MGTVFHEAGQVRALFDMYGVEAIDKGGDQIRAKAEEYLEQKQQQYRGDAYLDQIEKNAIYLSEGTCAVNLAIVRYLHQGEPVLRPEEITAFVLQTRMIQPQQATPFHLNFVRSGCSGCSVHDDHSRYATFRNMRVSGDWPKYVDELEFCCKYYQASYMVCQQYLAAFLHNHDLAHSAGNIPLQELAAVVQERIFLRTDLYMGNMKIQIGSLSAEDGLAHQSVKPASKGTIEAELQQPKASQDRISPEGLRGTLAGKGSIILRGKEYELVMSPFRMEGEKRSGIGITANVAVLKCPMESKGLLGHTKRCDTWIELVADFAPGAWFCPACQGLIMVDSRAEHSHYTHCSLVRLILDDMAMFFYFKDRITKDRVGLQDWIKKRSRGYEPMIATPYDKESQAYLDQVASGGKPVVLPQFIPLDQEWLDEQLRSK